MCESNLWRLGASGADCGDADDLELRPNVLFRGFIFRLLGGAEGSVMKRNKVFAGKPALVTESQLESTKRNPRSTSGAKPCYVS